MAKKRILFFEDDFTSISGLLFLLRKKYEITIGATQEIVNCDRNEDFDLLILDIMIHSNGLNPNPNSGSDFAINLQYPNIDWHSTGIELLKKIRDGKLIKKGIPKDIPVIVLTAREITKEELSKYKVNDVLIKPILLEVVYNTIERLLEREKEQ